MNKYLNSGNLVLIFGCELALATGYLLVIIPAATPNIRAAILMRLGLTLLWIILGGSLMRLMRGHLRAIFQNIRINPQITFVFFATFLALAEELITTLLTNLAPVFGVPMGAAYITASSNYVDVVCLHSVVVFVPMFVGWAWLLNRYHFSPNAVFLLFGITGVIAEVLYGGGQAFLETGLWVFVYGLMVYLPAYVFRKDRKTSPPRWWHYAAAIILPLILAVPVAIVIGFIHPVRVHFPPMQPGS
jgi:hypothetical protein